MALRTNTNNQHPTTDIGVSVLLTSLFTVSLAAFTSFKTTFAIFALSEPLFTRATHHLLNSGAMAASAKVQARVDLQADRSRELNITTTVVLVLSVVFVALRFWARHIRAGYGADDWMTVAALVHTYPRPPSIQKRI